VAPEPSLRSSFASSCASLASASEAGSRRVAPDVFSFAKVELEPLTPCGSLLRFSENPPPALVDSAARESDATAPAPSWMTCALGSLTYWEILVGMFLPLWRDMISSFMQLYPYFESLHCAMGK
jgi:hypothetical protein